MINSSSLHTLIKTLLLLPAALLATAAARAQSPTDGIIDYSTCGYRASETVFPRVTAVVRVAPVDGDNYEALQAAIDYVASLPADAEGHRGAVLLDTGTYTISQPLRISSDGIVLRGRGRDSTVIVKTGTHRGAAIYIEGTRRIVTGDTLDITDDVAPGDVTIHVAAPSLRCGDRVIVLRPSTKEWIAAMGMDDFGGGLDYTGWKASDIDLAWHRTVTAVTPGSSPTITLDAPLTCAIQAKWGGGKVVVGHNAGEIRECGVEHLSIEGCAPGEALTATDEDHCWDGILIDNAVDCRVRGVSFRRLAGSAVSLQRGARRITVEDCTADEPLSETGGGRRCVFLTRGEQTLIQRCVSHSGMHDFAAGYCAAGPNAFVQCEAEEALSFSGSIGSWACGLLFDIVDINGNNLTIANLEQFGCGTGYNAANTTLWQCTASTVSCYSPPTAGGDNTNRAVGCWGTLTGNAAWSSSNNHVQPRSLFYDQLARRVGDGSPDGRILPRNTNATSSPTIEQAALMAHEALTMPRLTLRQWIDSIVADELKMMSEELSDVPYITQVKADKAAKVRRHTILEPDDYSITNGRIVHNGELVTGHRYQPPWWNGRTKDNYVETKSKPAITRFVPGREGTGLTDRIDSVVTWMRREGYCLLDHNYGLWYDLRRTDHERVKRADGDVWAPFYEQPFARTGEGRAWDGLSLYDLTQPNRWYWARLKEYADKGASRGLLLFHENYFQHNIIEAGAHWVDCPWRPVNNVNGTDFPEPVPFTGDKRVFMAERFYDISNDVNTPLHKQYIRMCLDQLKDCPNVVHLISEEYTGPLHFVRFWLETIAEWEAETGRHPLVALSCTKDAQDAILADETLRSTVDIIDIRYWHYNTDSLWAPPAGTNLSPRQLQRKHKSGTVTAEGVYNAVRQYTAAYPDKAVTYFAQGYADNGWAVLTAGGSLPDVTIDNAKLRADIKDMTPMTTAADAGETPGSPEAYVMGNPRKGYIVYSPQGEATVGVAPATYRLYTVDTKTGAVSLTHDRTTTRGTLTLPQGVTWIERR